MNVTVTLAVAVCMSRWPHSVSTMALLVAISLPTIVFVVVSCIGAAYVQQVVLTTNYPQRLRR